jgi:hypothetical protein
VNCTGRLRPCRNASFRCAVLPRTHTRAHGPQNSNGSIPSELTNCTQFLMDTRCISRCFITPEYPQVWKWLVSLWTALTTILLTVVNRDAIGRTSDMRKLGQNFAIDPKRTSITLLCCNAQRRKKHDCLGVSIEMTAFAQQVLRCFDERAVVLLQFLGQEPGEAPLVRARVLLLYLSDDVEEALSCGHVSDAYSSARDLISSTTPRWWFRLSILGNACEIAAPSLLAKSLYSRRRPSD